MTSLGLGCDTGLTKSIRPRLVVLQPRCRSCPWKYWEVLGGSIKPENVHRVFLEEGGGFPRSCW
jgi:hypothetical protein